MFKSHPLINHLKTPAMILATELKCHPLTGSKISFSHFLSRKNLKRLSINQGSTLIDYQGQCINVDQSNGASQPQSDHLLIVNRQNDNLKTNEHELSDLKIGFKVFLNNDNQESFSEAIQKAFLILGVDTIDDLIISFKQKQSGDKKDYLHQIQIVRQTLEKFVKEEKIKQIGIADVEESTFRALHAGAQVKPSITQINLATCCVVPPTLQTFCKENDIKLLTHSDPSDILPRPSVEGIFGKPLIMKWALRFLILKMQRSIDHKGIFVKL